MNGLKRADQVFGQLQFDAVDVGLELRHAGRADDVAGQEGPAVDIGQRHPGRVEAVFLGQPDVGPGRGAGLGVGVAGKVVKQRQAAARGPRIIQVLAAQHAKAQRRIGQQPDLLALGKLGQADLEGPVQEIVRVLNADDARLLLFPREAQIFSRAPGRLVGDADMPHLAGLHELGQRRQGLLNRHAVFLGGMVIAEFAEEIGVPLRPVQLIQINIVCLQPF